MTKPPHAANTDGAWLQADTFHSSTNRHVVSTNDALMLVRNLHRGLKELSRFIGYSENSYEWFLARMAGPLMLQSSGRLAEIAEKATGLSPKTFREQRTIARCP
jgi:hypothetical protein